MYKKLIFLMAVLSTLVLSGCVVKIADVQQEGEDLAKLASTSFEVNPPVLMLGTDGSATINVNVNTLYANDLILKSVKLNYEDKSLDITEKLGETIDLSLAPQTQKGIFAVPVTVVLTFDKKGKELIQEIPKNIYFVKAPDDIAPELTCDLSTCELSVKSIEEDSELVPYAMLFLQNPEEATVNLPSSSRAMYAPFSNTGDSEEEQILTCTPVDGMFVKKYGTLQSSLGSKEVSLLTTALSSLLNSNDLSSYVGTCHNGPVESLAEYLFSDRFSNYIPLLTDADGELSFTFEPKMLSLYSTSSGQHCTSVMDYINNDEPNGNNCQMYLPYLKIKLPSKFGTMQEKHIEYTPVLRPDTLVLGSMDTIYCLGGICTASSAEHSFKAVFMSGTNMMTPGIGVEEIKFSTFANNGVESVILTPDSPSAVLNGTSITIDNFDNPALLKGRFSNLSSTIYIDTVKLSYRDTSFNLSTSDILFSIIPEAVYAPVNPHVVCPDTNPEDPNKNFSGVQVCQGPVSLHIERSEQETICVKVLDDNNNILQGYPVSFNFECNADDSICSRVEPYAKQAISNTNGLACFDTTDFRAPRIAMYDCDTFYESCSNSSISKYAFVASVGNSSRAISVNVYPAKPIGLSRFAYINGIRHDGFSAVLENNTPTCYLFDYGIATNVGEPRSFSLYLVDKFMNIVTPSSEDVYDSDSVETLKKLWNDFNLTKKTLLYSSLGTNTAWYTLVNLDLDSRKLSFEYDNLSNTLDKVGLANLFFNDLDTGDSFLISQLALKQAYGFSAPSISNVVGGELVSSITESKLEINVKSETVSFDMKVCDNGNFKHTADELGVPVSLISTASGVTTTKLEYSNPCYVARYSVDLSSARENSVRTIDIGIETKQMINSIDTVTLTIGSATTKPAKLSIEPTEITLDSNNPKGTFLVKNIGGTATDKLYLVLAKSYSVYFNIDSDLCTGKILDSGKSCSIAISIAKDPPVSNSLSLTVLDGQTSALAKIEIAVAKEPAKLVIKPTDLSLSTNEKAKISVSNIGGEDTGKLDVILPKSSPLYFKITSDECFGTTLRPQDSCDISIQTESKAGDLSLEVRDTNTGLSVSTAIHITSFTPPK